MTWLDGILGLLNFLYIRVEIIRLFVDNTSRMHVGSSNYQPSARSLRHAYGGSVDSQLQVWHEHMYKLMGSVCTRFI